MTRETTTGPTPGIRFAPNPTWCILESDDGRRFTIDCDGGPMLPRKTIATVYNSRRVDGKVNARLIASAPDLLAALRDALDVVDEVERSGCVCDEPPYCPEPGESGQVECPSCAARKVARLARAALSRAEGRGA